MFDEYTHHQGMAIFCITTSILVMRKWKLPFDVYIRILMKTKEYS